MTANKIMKLDDEDKILYDFLIDLKPKISKSKDNKCNIIKFINFTYYNNKYQIEHYINGNYYNLVLIIEHNEIKNIILKYKCSFDKIRDLILAIIS